jgi:hypothetical protein
MKRYLIILKFRLRYLQSVEKDTKSRKINLIYIYEYQKVFKNYAILIPDPINLIGNI